MPNACQPDSLDRHIRRCLYRPSRRNPDAVAIQAARDHGHNFGYLAARGTLPPDSLDPDEYKDEIMADLPFMAKRSPIFVAFVRAIMPRDDRKVLWHAYWAAVCDGIKDGVHGGIVEAKRKRSLWTRVFGA